MKAKNAMVAVTDKKRLMPRNKAALISRFDRGTCRNNNSITPADCLCRGYGNFCTKPKVVTSFDALTRLAEIHSLCSVKTITVEELHERTGDYVRAATVEPIVIADAGRQ